jgi:hypothetical protein
MSRGFSRFYARRVSMSPYPKLPNAIAIQICSYAFASRIHFSDLIDELSLSFLRMCASQFDTAHSKYFNDSTISPHPHLLKCRRHNTAQQSISTRLLRAPKVERAGYGNHNVLGLVHTSDSKIVATYGTA